MKSPLLAVVLGSAALLTGAAGLAQAEPQVGAGDGAKASGKTDCFFNRSVSNYTAKSDEVLYVRAGRDVYRMDMFGRCLDMDNGLSLALDSSPTGSICNAQDVRVIVPSSMGTQRCPVKAITKLTPAEVAALPKGDKP